MTSSAIARNDAHHYIDPPRSRAEMDHSFVVPNRMRGVVTRSSIAGKKTHLAGFVCIRRTLSTGRRVLVRMFGSWQMIYSVRYDESLHTISRHNEPRFCSTISRLFARMIRSTHHIRTSIKEEHSLPCVDLQPSRKVPHLRHPLSVMGGKEVGH